MKMIAAKAPTMISNSLMGFLLVAPQLECRLSYFIPCFSKNEARRIAANIAKLPVIAAAVALSVFAGGTAGSRLLCSWPDRWSPVFAPVPIARRHLVY
jgi:hypothetical protein